MWFCLFNRVYLWYYLCCSCMDIRVRCQTWSQHHSLFHQRCSSTCFLDDVNDFFGQFTIFRVTGTTALMLSIFHWRHLFYHITHFSAITGISPAKAKKQAMLGMPGAGGEIFLHNFKCKSCILVHFRVVKWALAKVQNICCKLNHAEAESGKLTWYLPWLYHMLAFDGWYSKQGTE